MAIDEPVDVLFRVEGDVVRDAHEYHLHSALKQHVADLMRRKDVWFGQLEDVKPAQLGRNWYLQVTPRTRYRIRCQVEVARKLLDLAGHDLRVGNHLLRFTSPLFEVPTPTRSMWCRAVALRPHDKGDRDNPHRRDFEGALYGWLTKTCGVPQLEVGRRRVVQIGQHSQTVFAVGLADLTEEQSRHIIRHGIGGRRNMGCGLFVSGALPQRLR